MEVLPVIRNYYNDIEMSADMMYLTNLPFFTLVSEDIHYRIVLAADNLEYNTLDRLEECS